MKHYLLAACLLLVGCGATPAPANTSPRDVLVTIAVNGTASVTFLNGTTLSQYTLTSDVRQERFNALAGTYVRVSLLGGSALAGVSCSIRVDNIKVADESASGVNTAVCDAVID